MLTPPSPRLRVAVAGASGYVGGELLRLLATHSRCTVTQVTSERLAGRFVHGCHPNLRGLYDLKFRRLDELQEADVLFLCLPHGHAHRHLDTLSRLAPRIVDCSADFRLRDEARHQRFYGDAPSPWRARFVYGLAELQGDALVNAPYISGVGCNATAVNLALAPLARGGHIRRLVADLKVGSSEGGVTSSAASHHPERSGAMRSFAPVGHRHQAEIAEQLELDEERIFLSVTSVEAVRGVLATCHVFLQDDLTDREIWQLYRRAYGEAPFVRLVNERRGLHRLPDPKILVGSNYCDIGWRLDRQPQEGGEQRLVVIAALDNLVKGAAGSALQALNGACGFDPRDGLSFPGLHPI